VSASRVQSPQTSYQDSKLYPWNLLVDFHHPNLCNEP